MIIQRFNEVQLGTLKEHKDDRLAQLTDYATDLTMIYMALAKQFGFDDTMRILTVSAHQFSENIIKENK